MGVGVLHDICKMLKIYFSLGGRILGLFPDSPVLILFYNYY